MYRGTEKIEEAPVFIEQLRESEQDFMFLTNNSTKLPKAVAEHLARFGVIVEEDKIYSTCIATAQYISKQKKEASVYVVGEDGLKLALQAAGCRLVTTWNPGKSCDFVVMGLDRQVSYEKLVNATLAVRAGATFISTNSDKAFPSERGLLPGNGSLTAVVSTSTQTAPIFIGKPEPLMIELIMKEKGLHKEDVVMIGDNYETDILAGIAAGIDTALVFTGFTSKEDLNKVEVKPTYQWNTLLDWKNSFLLLKK